MNQFQVMPAVPTEIASSGEGACSFCANSHKVSDAIVTADYALLTDFNGEASVRKFVSDGYTALNF
jgi:hypothetical protein